MMEIDFSIRNATPEQIAVMFSGFLKAGIPVPAVAAVGGGEMVPNKAEIRKGTPSGSPKKSAKNRLNSQCPSWTYEELRTVSNAENTDAAVRDYRKQFPESKRSDGAIRQKFTVLLRKKKALKKPGKVSEDSPDTIKSQSNHNVAPEEPDKPKTPQSATATGGRNKGQAFMIGASVKIVKVVHKARGGIITAFPRGGMARIRLSDGTETTCVINGEIEFVAKPGEIAQPTAGATS